MNLKVISEHKKEISLTKIQRSLIVGKLLGDGHLETQNNGKTYRLKIEHSEKQIDYVEWMFKILKPLVKTDIQTKINSKSVRFQTLSFGELRFYGQQFYKDGRKVIPKLFSKLIDELSLAIWFMDDGSKKSSKHNTYIIHSLGYTKKELRQVCEVLDRKFNLKFNLYKQKNKNWCMYLQSKSIGDFESMILPYVLRFKSMEHKIGNINA